MFSLLPWSRFEQERLQILTLWLLKQVQEQEIMVEIISNRKQFHILSLMRYMNDHTQSIITQACNKNMGSKRAWVSNIMISSFNFYKPQIS
jgi:hypothetical protein